MRVLMIANKIEGGGAPKSMLEMASELKNSHGAEVTVLVNGRGKLYEMCKSAGIECVIAPHEPFIVGRGSTPMRKAVKFILRPYFALKSYYINKKSLKKIGSLIDFSTIDIIHTNSNRDNFGALLSEKFGVKHIWHLREFGKEDYDCAELFGGTIDFMNKNTTRFVAISDAVRKAWIAKGIEEDKITRVYNGVNVDKIVSDAERRSILSEEIKIAFTGTICPAKGQKELIEAIGLVDIKLREKIHVDFYGEGPKEYIEQLKKYAKKTGVYDNISFRGLSDRLGEILHSYNVAAVCSRSEAFGRITPEYMAAGLITIASNTGANPELIDDGVTGFLYQYGNPKSLAEIIEKISEMSTKDKLSISYSAEKKAREKYTSRLNGDNIFNLYSEVCGV